MSHPMGRGPRGYRRSDERIGEEISERIARSGAWADDVEVSVNGGEVTLTGMVDDRREKLIIEEISDSVYGVKDVHNQIRVREGDPSSRMMGPPRGAMMGSRM
jgi:osmotically-inducible protein OsmY